METELRLYLIQGFFFQRRGLVGIRHTIEGAIAVIQQGLVRDQFAGVLFPSDQDPEEYNGLMSDRIGESELSDVVITEDEFSFTKKYTFRDDPIRYTFHNEGDIWVGTYTGPAVGSGTANCILTKVSKDLFDPHGGP